MKIKEYKEIPIDNREDINDKLEQLQKNYILHQVIKIVEYANTDEAYIQVIVEERE
jgi:hypothetical protein